MLIGPVDVEKTVLVVAEIGNNHEGDLGAARELVHAAAGCGVHAVKFQTFRTKYFVSGKDPARFARLRSFELTFDGFAELERLARGLGLLFLSTPLDLESAAFLRNLVDAYKVASGDNDFLPLLDWLCGTGKPLIVSTGVSDLARVERTKRFVEEAWRARSIDQRLAVLHCVSSYPVPEEEANLASIPFLAEKLGGAVGYSDHTVGIQACLAATALGARILEKHFTLDHDTSDFRDHKLSADPREMKDLVAQVVQIGRLLGSRGKVVQPCEAANAPLIRRSIAAGRDLSRGHALAAGDLTWLRPAAGGLPPGDEGKLIGRRLVRDVTFGEQLKVEDVG